MLADTFRDLLSWSGPPLITVLVAIAAYWLISKTFANQPQNRLYRQLAQVALVILAIITLLLVIPVDVETRGQLLGLLGLVLTAVIALSSTTFVSNAMAGLTLKAMGSFHAGDFIRVADHFGRVTAKALLHTEIQSEDRDIITLPNLFVMTNPVQVVDQSGTLISANLTLGFDVNRTRVRELLIEAAEAAGLGEAFVQVVTIGNYAVEYKVVGFLEEVGQIVSKRSELKSSVLDTLHAAGIEIMSPTIMNQRPVDPSLRFIPQPVPAPQTAESDTGQAERMMFDKAEMAARVQGFRDQVDALTTEIKELEADDEDHALEISWKQHQLKSLQDFLLRLDESG